MRVYKPQISLFKKAIALFLIVMVGTVFGCKTIFMHSHKIGDVIVWHSHPFPNAQHSSPNVYFTIAFINSSAISFAELFTFHSFNNEFICDVESDVIQDIPQITDCTAGQRAPPFSVTL